MADYTDGGPVLSVITRSYWNYLLKYRNLRHRDKKNRRQTPQQSRLINRKQFGKLLKKLKTKLSWQPLRH